MKKCFAKWAGLLAVVAGAPALWLVVEAQEQSAEPPRSADAAVRTDAEARQPVARAVVDETSHPFGVIDPTGEVGHTFVIRNEGSAPLELARGRTTCKCTMSDLPSGEVAPGAAAEVHVASKIHQKHGHFSHSAEILTNDPENAVVVLKISGTIRTQVGASPARIVLSATRRDEPQVATVTLYSQAWDAFSIEGTSASLEGIECESTPADPETLEKLGATSGYRLEVTVPPSVESGSHWDWLKLTLRPADPAESARTFELDISRNVPERISVSGPHVEPTLDAEDEQGRVIKMGYLRHGEGAQERFTVQVRDDHRELRIERIETEPGFLKIHPAPGDAATARFGLYLFDVEVPPDAPPSNYKGDRRGEIRIVTDHPKMPVLTVKVDFAIASS